MEEDIVNSCPEGLQGSAASLFLTLINALLLSKCSFSTESNYPRNFGPKVKDGDTFDFIVVGAGSAGSVVASRLSENPNWKVLLVEAGTYPSANSEIPQLVTDLQNSKENWNYTFEPSKYLKFNHKTFCSRGKGLGGSSLINHMLYFRGNRYDYDRWKEAGNREWDFNLILPCYKKFEHLQGDDGNTRFGRNGELKITKLKTHKQLFMSHLVEAYKDLGYNSDYNEEKPLGTLFGYFTNANGKRYSSAKAFLGGNAKLRTNLYLALNAQVSKLLINSDLTVRGVEMRMENKLYKVYARNEVILSAGSVNSPQILMNSGIGPKAHLKNIGIKVLKDLKVGQNLQNHILMPGIFYKLHKSAFPPSSDMDNIDAIYQYFMYGTGPFSELGLNFQGFVNPKNDSDLPTTHIYHELLHKKYITNTQSDILIDLLGLPKLVSESVKKANERNHIIELTLGLTYPKSKGEVVLRTNNPFDHPLIFTNDLSNNQDVTDLIDSIRFVQKLMKSIPLQVFNPEYVQIDLPECQEFIFDTDEYWDCLIRHFVRGVYHLVGTCKMGPESDPDAVVNSRLKVHGVKGLRVIDGSIMPSIVGVNTNGPIILIGERGSQLIKEDYKVEKNEL